MNGHFNILRKGSVLLLICMIMSLTHGYGQGIDPGDTGLGGTADQGIPVDGGVAVLLAAGISLAGKKVAERKKKKN